MFGSKRYEVIGKVKKIDYAEVHDLYSSSDIMRIIRSRSMDWAENVACVEHKR
jgi:DNA-binding Lrp family transcriptional regulator